MASQRCTVGPVIIGGDAPLTIIAGPCSLEDDATNHTIAARCIDICAELGLPYVFKASFDKANRTSVHSNRGRGLQAGLATLAAIKAEFDVPVTTDVHEAGQAAAVAEVADLLQIPAFLCRQTDLIVACAKTRKPVNVKKGQFLSPHEMGHVVEKLHEANAAGIVLTERGTFFGYHRLVNDFIGLGDLMELGPPVCFDVTHSTQLPGGGAQTTDGRREHAPLLARAAVAAGVDALFIECHPEPARAISDASTQLPLDELPELLRTVVAIRSAVRGALPSYNGG